MNSRTGELLYPGPDLKFAAERSSAGDRGRIAVQGTANAAATILELARRRLRRREQPRHEWTMARGIDPATGGELTVAYAGDGSNQAWCFGMAFPEHEIAERCENLHPDALARRLDGDKGADLVFLDGLPRAWWPGRLGPFLAMPAWVKQRVRVLGDWHAQIDGLRRETRQETARTLRKHRYRCELTRQAEDYRHFHDSLYRPYVEQRFGASAYLVDRDTVLRQCRRGILLRLFEGDRLLGASLLCPLARTMAVVWSALDPARSPGETRGATDALDYFSLLYTHLRGCRWLDLGPSRPDLCDGVLRYKAKWGGEVHPGLVPQRTIRLAWHGRNPAVRGFLTRHAFVARNGRGLQAVVLADGANAEARISALRTPGIRSYRRLRKPL